MTKNSYIPEPTDPKEVMAARAQAERTQRAKLAFDDELIRRMDEGPMIDASDIDWDQMRENALRIAASPNMITKKYVPEPTDPREVMAALAYAEQVREAEEALDQKLIEGLDSGRPIEMEDLDWASLDQIIETAAGRAGRR